MSLRKIRVFPDPILRKKCKPVKLIDSSIKKLALDMVETMGYLGGVGLAANQVGIDAAVAVVNVTPDDIVASSSFGLVGLKPVLFTRTTSTFDK